MIFKIKDSATGRPDSVTQVRLFNPSVLGHANQAASGTAPHKSVSRSQVIVKMKDSATGLKRYPHYYLIDGK